MKLIESSFPCNYCGQASEVEHDCVDVLRSRLSDANSRIRSLEHDHKVMKDALAELQGDYSIEGSVAERINTALSSLLVKDGE